MYKYNMACRYCKSEEDETQEHLTICSFTKEMKDSLDLTQEKDQLILWRKITRALKQVHKDDVNIQKDNNNTDEVDVEIGNCENLPNQTGFRVPSVASRETCQGDR